MQYDYPYLSVCGLSTYTHMLSTCSLSVERMGPLLLSCLLTQKVIAAELTVTDLVGQLFQVSKAKSLATESCAEYKLPSNCYCLCSCLLDTHLEPTEMISLGKHILYLTPLPLAVSCVSVVVVFSC